jgi:hypothetical protein
VLPDDRNPLTRGDIEARHPIVFRLSAEVLGEELLRSGEAKASAHEEEYSGGSYAIDLTTPPSTRTDAPVVADAASLHR